MLTAEEMQAMRAMMEKMMMERRIMRCFKDRAVEPSAVSVSWKKASVEMSPEARAETRLLLFHGPQKCPLVKEIIRGMYEREDRWHNRMLELYEQVPMHVLVLTKPRYRDEALRALGRMQLYSANQGIGMILKEREYTFSKQWLDRAGRLSGEIPAAVLHAGWLPDHLIERSAM
ncbi:hypothetical protein ACFO4L_05200 [Bacillus daqingensis]|uniref:Uncharacterized protein n=1 Tax=Bacillus daqingensis TaxID=872396 RepID=A0ABV9NRM2_9BACI